MYRMFFFTGPPVKKTKSKIMLEYPVVLPKKLKYMDWASPKIQFMRTQGYYHHLNWILGGAQSGT